MFTEKAISSNKNVGKKTKKILFLFQSNTAILLYKDRLTE